MEKLAQKAYKKIIGKNNFTTPEHNFAISDYRIHIESDFVEPLTGLAEACQEAIYITPKLCSIISDSLPKTEDQEAALAFFFGHELYHFLSCTYQLSENYKKKIEDYTPILVSGSRLEQIETKADILGVLASEKAGYELEDILEFYISSWDISEDGGAALLQCLKHEQKNY